MGPQAFLGLAVALQTRSAIAQQNVITLGNMLLRRPIQYMPKRSKLLRVFKDLSFVFSISTLSEKSVQFLLYLVYNSLIKVLICKFIIIHNNFE